MIIVALLIQIASGFALNLLRQQLALCCRHTKSAGSLCARRSAASSHANTNLPAVSCVKPSDGGTALSAAGWTSSGALPLSPPPLPLSPSFRARVTPSGPLSLSVGTLTTVHHYVPKQNGLFSACFSDSAEEENRRRGGWHRHGPGSHHRDPPAGPNFQDRRALRDDGHLSDDL